MRIKSSFSEIQFTGALLLLPTPNEGSIIHVANTLPSAANLRIIVSYNMSMTVVCMDRVIAALKHLKAEHSEYKEVT